MKHMYGFADKLGMELSIDNGYVYGKGTLVLDLFRTNVKFTPTIIGSAAFKNGMEALMLSVEGDLALVMLTHDSQTHRPEIELPLAEEQDNSRQRGWTFLLVVDTRRCEGFSLDSTLSTKALAKDLADAVKRVYYCASHQSRDKWSYLPEHELLGGLSKEDSLSVNIEI